MNLTTLIELIWTITPAVILILIAFPAGWCGKSSERVKLPNSGDALKLIIPSNYGNIICGWSNYSCMVTSYKIIERWMGNRGSKSVLLNNNPVKEQRVYGSWCGLFLPHLRCTLMGFVRNSQIKILSNRINTLRFYTSSAASQLQELVTNPWFLTGFADGESCFSININRDNKRLLGWSVQANFSLVLHKKDVRILYSIKKYFGVGNVFSRKDDICVYLVQSVKDLAVIINHFDKYPLITKKQADYLLFKMAVSLINNKEHLKEEGLLKIIAIKSSLNRGLSLNLEAAFTNIIPYPRPSVFDYNIKDPNWLAGFISAEGCFLINIRSKSKMKTGYFVELGFNITQHSRDKELIKSIVKYLECGNVYNNENKVEFKITKFADLAEKLIPFLNKYPIQGVKLLDFQDFFKVVKLIKDKSHLTEKGLNQIIKIKAGINRGRK